MNADLIERLRGYSQGEASGTWHGELFAEAAEHIAGLEAELECVRREMVPAEWYATANAQRNKAEAEAHNAHLAVKEERALASAAESALSTALKQGEAEGLRKAALDERERIAKALEEEADLLPCTEDAAITRGNAWLVRADFSYEEAERLEGEADARALLPDEEKPGSGEANT